MWILVALRSEPLVAARLLDEIRELDGWVGPGALFASVARLERHGLIEAVVTAEGRQGYRLAQAWRADLVAQAEGVSS